MSDHNFETFHSKKSDRYYIFPRTDAWNSFFLDKGLKMCSFRTINGDIRDAYCKEHPSELDKTNLRKIVSEINSGSMQPRKPKKEYVKKEPATGESKLGRIIEGNGERYQLLEYGKAYAIYGVGYQEKNAHDLLKANGISYTKGGEMYLNTKPWMVKPNDLDVAIEIVRILNGHREVGEEEGEKEEKPKVLKKGNVKYQRIVYEVELPHIGQRVIIKVDEKDDINTKVKSISNADEDIVDLIVFESGHNAVIISGRWEILEYTASYIDHTIIFK